jgi:NAD-dependent deacetylase
MDAIQAALSRCELFISIGTSGKVYPAAGFVTWARQIGAYTVEVNFEPTDVSGAFHSQRVGPASSAVPALVSDILAGNWKM